MTSNHEEYSSDITCENLKGSVQKYWGFVYLCRKVPKEETCFEVIDLAFSNFSW